MNLDKPEQSTANNYQIGGDHYRSEIQHWDFVLANNIPYLEAQIIKYVFRWRKKGGVQDLNKAKHFLEKLLDVANGEEREWKLREDKTRSELRRESLTPRANYIDTGEPGRAYADQGRDRPL